MDENITCKMINPLEENIEETCVEMFIKGFLEIKVWSIKEHSDLLDSIKLLKNLLFERHCYVNEKTTYGMKKVFANHLYVALLVLRRYKNSLNSIYKTNSTIKNIHNFWTDIYNIYIWQISTWKDNIISHCCCC